jgi:TDG/mug DNA glycosylase family protein
MANCWNRGVGGRGTVEKMARKDMRTVQRQSETLPDYLREGLDLVFVGLNPGLYYFAYRHNRFWPALSASGLVPDIVGPEDDTRLLEWGIGLTDIVKRPTSGIHELSPAEFRRGAKALQEKIEHYHPLVVCFVGLTGYEVCCGKQGRGSKKSDRFGGVPVFVIPSTSPRNARYSLEEIIAAMRDLGEYLQRVKEGEELSNV